MFDVNDNISYNKNTYNRMTMIDDCFESGNDQLDLKHMK